LDVVSDLNDSVLLADGAFNITEASDNLLSFNLQINDK